LAEVGGDWQREVLRLLKASKANMPTPTDEGIDFYPFGFEAVRASLELIVRYSAQQRLIPRAYAVDELFDDTTRMLT
jgi:4,5-dihydroxyphthalate decarboxylase